MEELLFSNHDKQAKKTGVEDHPAEAGNFKAA